MSTTTTARVDTRAHPQGLMNPAALALLLGHPEPVVRGWINGGGVPDSAVRDGRRRTKEASAALGVNDCYAILGYWAMDAGASLVIDDIPVVTEGVYVGPWD